MKSIDSAASRLSTKSPSQFLSEYARRILFSRLNTIEIGHLIIEDESGTYVFGQDVSSTSLVARISVYRLNAYREILLGGGIGAGESYMRGDWVSTDLVSVVRLIAVNQSVLDNMDSTWSWLSKRFSSITELLRINTKAGSKKNIAAHYDLSNAFFSLFLDKSMMYSAAIFPSSDASLESAALIKLDHICKRLNLNESDHLLEIGSGWGGMAVYAAKHYGCRVTTTTISRRQYELVLERVEREGLSDRIEVLFKDYRELSGTYDKLVSIEMVEAVGHQYHREFFSGCARLLKPNGLMLMQAITTQDQRFEREKNKMDFIQKYIFPGGCLPSNEAVIKNVSKHTDMHLVGLDDITLDYALTLGSWRKRFFDKIDTVKSLGFDDTFVRMWDFYLCYCEGGFRERVINTSQFLLAKPMCRDLPVIRHAEHKPLF